MLATKVLNWSQSSYFLSAEERNLYSKEGVNAKAPSMYQILYKLYFWIPLNIFKVISA